MTKLFKNTSILRPILAILLLFIPLYPKFPLASVSGIYVAIRLDDVIVSLAIFFWIIYQIRHCFPVIRNRTTPLFIVYLLAILTSTITAILVFKTDPPGILLINALRRLEYISLFFIATDAITSRQDLKFPYFFLVLATALVSLFGIGQKYFQFPVVSTMNEEFSKGYLLTLTNWTRINSTFAGHYDLAAFLSVSLIIIGCLALVSKKPFYYKIPVLIIWLTAFQILTFTASRVSYFAFWGGMVLTLILIRKFLWIIPISLLVIYNFSYSSELNQRLLATIQTIKPNPVPTIIVPIPSPTLVPTIKQPIVTPTKILLMPTLVPTIVRHQPTPEYPLVDVDVGVARSGEIRFNVEWPRAITAFLKNPLVGTGLGSITLATDNDYLRTLGESGLFGFISLAAIFFWFFLQTLRHRQAINIIFLGALITTLINAIFIDVFVASKTAYLFWMMMGVYYQSLTNEKT